MKIHNSDHISNLQSYRQTSTHPIDKEKMHKKQESDQLKISSRAKQILEQKSRGETIDEIKINRIKEQIADGTYKPNSDQIAGKLLSLWKNSLTDRGRSE